MSSEGKLPWHPIPSSESFDTPLIRFRTQFILLTTAPFLRSVGIRPLIRGYNTITAYFATIKVAESIVRLLMVYVNEWDLSAEAFRSHCDVENKYNKYYASGFLYEVFTELDKV